MNNLVTIYKLYIYKYTMLDVPKYKYKLLLSKYYFRWWITILYKFKSLNYVKKYFYPKLKFS